MTATFADPSYQTEAVKPKSGALFKTQLCRHFEQKGFCNMGDSWSFAHGKEELREAPPGSTPSQTYNYGSFQPKGFTPGLAPTTDTSKYYKTVLCKHFQQTGQCQFGVNCKFAHGEAELRPAPPGGAYTPPSYNSYVTPSSYGAYSTQQQQPATYYPGYEVNYAGYQTQPAATPGYEAQTPVTPGYEATSGAAQMDPSQNYSYNYGGETNYYQSAEGYNYGGGAVTSQTTVGEGETAPQYYSQTQTMPTTGSYQVPNQDGYQQ